MSFNALRGVWLVVCCAVGILLIVVGVGLEGGESWQDRQAREWPAATAAALTECAARRPGERVMPDSWEVIFECRAGLPRVVSR
jgi:hypothetical protein